MGWAAGSRHDGDLLQEVARGLLQTLEALRDSKPVELIEAELEIPFVGTLADDAASVGLKHFRNVSLLTEDINSSRASDIWKICIAIGRDNASVLRVERYDSPATS